MHTFSIFLATSLFALSAFGGDVVKLSEQRILLGAVLPDVAAGLAEVDLGPAPPPGKSRLLSYSDISYRLKSLGISASTLALPKDGVRVESIAKVFSPRELEALVRPAVESALPPGFVLRSLRVAQDWVLSPEVSVSAVDVSSLSASTACSGGPKKPSCREGITAELVWGNQPLGRLPVQLELDVSQRVAAPPVPRGTILSLSVVKGNVAVTVLAETMASAKIGEVVMLRAQATKKVMSAKLVSPTRAEIAL